MDYFIRKDKLLPRMNVSGVTLWRWEKAGLFPKRIRLGGNVVAWVESEIEEWFEHKKAERTAGNKVDANS